MVFNEGRPRFVEAGRTAWTALWLIAYHLALGRFCLFLLRQLMFETSPRSFQRSNLTRLRGCCGQMQASLFE